jgi:phytoene dehydrogenase-like protein
MNDVTAVVAGGGVAGLVAARHLAERGVDVTVYERESEPGGRVRSVRRDGFVLDRGFQVLFTAYPEARRHLDYDALDLRTFAPGATVCRPNHRATVADPLRDPTAIVESALTREITFRDKLRVLRLRHELASKPAAAIFAEPDRSIREYLREKGFSGRFVRNFAAPFYGGITLDRSLSTSSKVFEFTFKMLATGDTVVPARGMGAISAQLADRAEEAGATVETGVEVTGVEAGDQPAVELGGETRAADAVVVATDPPTARDLTGVESIPTDAHGCVTQFYRLPADAWPDTGRRLLLNAAGDAAPGTGDPGPNQIAPLSEVAPEYSPDDTALLAATYLGQPDASDDDLGARTYSTLSSWFPARSFADLRAVHTERIPFAQFAQPPGIFDSLPRNRAPDGSVYLAGDYTEASSLNAAMASGRKAAEMVISDL